MRLFLLLVLIPVPTMAGQLFFENHCPYPAQAAVAEPYLNPTTLQSGLRTWGWVSVPPNSKIMVNVHPGVNFVYARLHFEGKEDIPRTRNDLSSCISWDSFKTTVSIGQDGLPVCPLDTFAITGFQKLPLHPGTKAGALIMRSCAPKEPGPGPGPAKVVWCAAASTTRKEIFVEFKTNGKEEEACGAVQEIYIKETGDRPTHTTNGSFDPSKLTTIRISCQNYIETISGNGYSVWTKAILLAQENGGFGCQFETNFVK